MILSQILVIVALVIIMYGAIEGYGARGFLTPEAEAHHSAWVFWRLANFTEHGQQLLRRGRWIQAAGVALLIVAIAI